MEISTSGRRRIRLYELVLRILGLGFTSVAAVLVGISKQTATTVPVTIAEGLPIWHLPLTAKWHYMSAFVYFLVSNAIACSYAAGSVVYSRIAAPSYEHNSAMALSILDLIIMALLFSANGAAAAMGIIGRNGNSHAQWRKVCDVFHGYCHHLEAGIVLSLIGSFAFLLLVLLAVLGAHKSSN